MTEATVTVPFILYCGHCFGMFLAPAVAVRNGPTGVLTNECSDSWWTFQRDASLLCKHLRPHTAAC